MDLYLFRHGIAADAPPGGDDADRPLTEKGIARTRLGARGLATLKVAPTLILTSPKRRARQTADLLAEVFEVPVHEDPRLAVGSEHRDLEAIREADAESLIVVGHQPDLGYLGEWLVFGQTVGRFELGKAGCIGLRFDGHGPAPGAARLRFLATPRTLRQLAGEAPDQTNP